MKRRIYSTNVVAVGQFLLVAGSVGYALHWPWSNIMLLAGLALNVTAIFKLLGLQTEGEPDPEELEEKEALDVPMDGGFRQQRPESRPEKWMGTLSALCLACALLLQIIRMMADDAQIQFIWIIISGMLFVVFDVLRRIFRNNQ